VQATVEDGLQPDIFRIKYKIENKPLISVIIPTINKVNYLQNCISSILQKTDYSNYEIIIIDTGSQEKKTWDYYKELKNNPKIRLLKWQKKFNYASVNNFAVAKAKGQYVLLLNNDIEVISNEWLESMLEHAQRPEIGAVGAKLLYPNNTIQHSGVILGINKVAGHAQKLFLDDQPGRLPIFNSKDLIKNWSAVTAACLMVEKNKYQLVGGMNEQYQIAFNDIDFCLKLGKKGLFNIYTPYAKLYHHESISVGRPENGNRDMKKFKTEIALLQKKWHYLLKNDPYYNPNLTLEHEDFSII
jgi:O-antigen biosynthesis protein